MFHLPTPSDMRNLHLFIIVLVLLFSFCKKEHSNNSKSVSIQSTYAENFLSTHKNQPLENYISYPKNKKNLTAILIIHEWTGLGEYVKKRAKMLSKLGYFVYAMDMYGKGNRATNHKEASALMKKYKDNPSLMLDRIESAISDIKTQFPQVNKNKVFGIGYCFGGGALLKLAYSGSNSLKAIVSFHGMLAPPTKKELSNIKVNMEIHHGDKDSFIPKTTVSKFKKKMLSHHKILYRFHHYPNAKHAFTRWSAIGEPGSENIVYHKESDEASWKRMLEFINLHSLGFYQKNKKNKKY